MMWKRLIAGGWLLMSLLSLFGQKHPASPTPSAPGTLVGLHYASSGGSMEWRSEFEIEVTPEELVHSACWPEDWMERKLDEPAQRDHVPLTVSQWAELERIVLTLYPQMQEAVPAEAQPLPDDVVILDGGDYQNLWLTWRTAEGDRTALYAWPSDRRVTTLHTLLWELADPRGREVVWYEPPVLSGIWFHSDRAHFSYQCTPWSGEEGDYDWIVHTGSGAEAQYLQEYVDASFWQRVRTFCEPLRLERFPSGSYRDDLSCTLYYSDGTQRCVIPDRVTARALRVFFAALAEQLGGA